MHYLLCAHAHALYCHPPVICTRDTCLVIPIKPRTPAYLALLIQVRAQRPQSRSVDSATVTELAKLSRAQLLELNQKFLEETGLETRERELISPRFSMSQLRGEYEGAPAFVRRIDWLIDHGHTTVRRSRGDGDCFYRCALRHA